MPADLWPIVAIAGEFALRLVIVGALLVRRPPRAAANLAWIVVVLAVPVLGVIAYLLVGEVRLGRRRMERHAAIASHLGRAMTEDADRAAALRPDIPVRYQPIATLAEAVGGHPPVAGNQLRLISETRDFVASLAADIDAAREHCHLLFYIFLDDGSGRRIATALSRAAQRGVSCRLLVDAVGSRPFLRSATRRELEAQGVRVVEALPASIFRVPFARVDLRNHRKIAVIDSVIGYMGSHNLADAEFAVKPRHGPWVDAVVRIHGPATLDLHELFIVDWYLDTNETLAPTLNAEAPIEPDGSAVQVMGTGPNAFNQALRQLMISAMHTARSELIMTTPYFVPDEATEMALRAAARRGVDTVLIVPARNDSPVVAAAARSHYGMLLDAGVRIHEYEKGLLHAKTITLDRDFAVISSANLDRRSFELNFEVSLGVFDSDFASQLRFLQQSYLADSRRVDPRAWRARPWTTRLWQNGAGTLGPLL